MPALTRTLVPALCLLLLAAMPSLRAEVSERAVTRAFLTLVAGEERDVAGAVERIESTWEPSYLPMQ